MLDDAAMVKGRVSSRVARSQSPARSASRMRVDEIGPPSSRTAATVSAVMPVPRRAAPASRHRRRDPLPKVKSSPVTTPAAPSRSTSHSAMNSLRRSAREILRRTEDDIASTRRLRTAARADPSWSAGTAAHRAGRSASDGDRRWRPAPAAPCAGTRQRAADHRLVAEMESIEIAERDDAAAQMRGDRSPVEPFHGAPIAEGWGRE